MFLAGYVPGLHGRGTARALPAGSRLPRSRRRRCWARSGARYRGGDRRASRSTTGSRWCASPRARARRTTRAPVSARRAEREGRFGVVMIGVAQEKAYAWRGWREGGNDAHPHFEFGRQAVFVNHYYFYIRDPEWGPAFIKTVRLRAVPGVAVPQRARVGQAPGRPSRGSGSRRSTTAFAPARTPTRWRRSARALSDARRRGASSRAGWRGCRRRSPPPTAAAATATRSRSASWSSPTRACSTGPQPAARGLSARSRDQLDARAPRPGQRRLRPPDHPPARPGAFRPRSSPAASSPAIQAHYKHSKVKQYFKDGRALRTETTVNDPYDFGVGRLLTAENWARAARGSATHDQRPAARRPT